MKLFLMATVLVTSSAFAGWTSPEGMTPVKQEVVKEETRNPASNPPATDKGQTKEKTDH